MNNFQSAIRREMVLTYLKAHPDVKYKDIGIACGYGSGAAKTMVGNVAAAHGIQRKRGLGSPAWDAPHPDNGIVPVSRKRAERLLRNRRLSYSQIATKLNCSWGTVRDIAKELGLQRGLGNRECKKFMPDRDFLIHVTDMRAAGLKNKEIAAKLGYKPKSIYNRLARLGAV